MEDLQAFLAMAWDFLSMRFALWGYSFSFAEIMIFGVCAGWLIFVWVQWVLD